MAGPYIKYDNTIIVDRESGLMWEGTDNGLDSTGKTAEHSAVPILSVVLTIDGCLQSKNCKPCILPRSLIRLPPILTVTVFFILITCSR